MTQDAQKFTDGDLKKAKETVSNCPNEHILDGLERARIGISHIGENSGCACSICIAQALRDERKGLEEELAGIRKRFDERLATPNEYEKHLIAKPLHERLKSLEAENGEFQMRIMELATENARLKAELSLLWKQCENSPTNSEAKVICEHDKGAELGGGFRFERKPQIGALHITKERICPFCDKKTGGV